MSKSPGDRLRAWPGTELAGRPSSADTSYVDQRVLTGRRASALRVILTIAAVIVAASPVDGQSLAEVARQEEARRKAIAQPGKVYTIADLKRVALPSTGGAASEPAGGAATGGGAPGAGAGQAAGSPAATSAPVQEPAAEPVQDEAWWRKRITDARTELARTDTLLAALQSRANALLNDFTARDDPAQRAQIARERQATLDELARMTAERQTRADAIAAIEEEARQAGVPPGWLRL